MPLGPGTVLALVLTWLLLNGVDAVWMYFYVQTLVNPNPHSAINKTNSAFQEYQEMMFIFGFFWGCVNVFVVWKYFKSEKIFKEGFVWILANLFNFVIVLPAFAFLIVMPFFGGFIVVPLVQEYAWNHHCDSYPMYAIIDAKGYSDSNSVPNVAHFFQRSSPNSMFTFDIFNPSVSSSDDLWSFSLEGWDQPQRSIPVQFYPTLQRITLDFNGDSFSGNCTVPIPGSIGGYNTTLGLCTQGTFSPGNFLALNISSSVPLNTTITNVSSLPFSNTQLRSRDNQWSSENSDVAPSLILETVDPVSGELQGYAVMKTTVTKRGDCTQLKVCLNGVHGQETGPVGAETLVPLGIIALKQSDYALVCSQPDDDYIPS